MEQIIEEYGIGIIILVVGVAVLGGFHMLFQLL